MLPREEKGFLLSPKTLGSKYLPCDAQKGWDRGGFFCHMSMGRMSAWEDGAPPSHSAPPPQPTAQHNSSRTRMGKVTAAPSHRGTAQRFSRGNRSAPLRIPNKSRFGADITGEPFARRAVRRWHRTGSSGCSIPEHHDTVGPAAHHRVPPGPRGSSPAPPHQAPFAQHAAICTTDSHNQAMLTLLLCCKVSFNWLLHPDLLANFLLCHQRPYLIQ